MCILSGYTNDARQNERKARIRIYSKFQSHAKYVQSETAGQGVYTFSLNHPSTSPSGGRRPMKHPSPYTIDLQPIPVEKLVKCKMQCVFFSVIRRRLKQSAHAHVLLKIKG